MKGLLAIIIGLVAAAAFLLRPSVDPSAEQQIAMPRAQLYAELEQLYGAIEKKSGHIKTVTGTPPIPVDFTFERSEGEMIGLTGTAGMRTVEVKAWLEDGAAPGSTLLKVKFWPEDLYKKSGYQDLRRALEQTLKRTDAQFIEGHRITTLFGGQEVATR